MAPAASAIRFTATLHRPADAPDNATWTFLVLPKQASSRLPTRGVTTIEGTLNDRPFRANVEPDGEKSHWLKVPRALRAAAEIGRASCRERGEIEGGGGVLEKE